MLHLFSARVINGRVKGEARLSCIMVLIGVCGLLCIMWKSYSTFLEWMGRYHHGWMDGGDNIEITAVELVFILDSTLFRVYVLRRSSSSDAQQTFLLIVAMNSHALLHHHRHHQQHTAT
jgi:hypothetical protein